MCSPDHVGLQTFEFETEKVFWNTLCVKVLHLHNCYFVFFYKQGRLEQEFKFFPRYRKYWNLVKKKDSQADQETLER